MLTMHTMPESNTSNTIPVEVVIKIFGELSLPDALHLAATSCQLCQVLDENTPTIYKPLRRNIQCEGYARVLLVDQGGLPSDSSSVTIQDLSRLRRNSRMAEKAINMFDRDITPHIRSEYRKDNYTCMRIKLNYISRSSYDEY
jgi:hypothetical protein